MACYIPNLIIVALVIGSSSTFIQVLLYLSRSQDVVPLKIQIGILPSNNFLVVLPVGRLVGQLPAAK